MVQRLSPEENEEPSLRSGGVILAVLAIVCMYVCMYLHMWRLDCDEAQLEIVLFRHQHLSPRPQMHRQGMGAQSADPADVEGIT